MNALEKNKHINRIDEKLSTAVSAKLGLNRDAVALVRWIIRAPLPDIPVFSVPTENKLQAQSLGLTVD